MGRRVITLILFILSFGISKSQNAELANAFYLNKEFEKALEEYLELYRLDVQNYYEDVVKCYQQIGDFKGGRKFCKKHLKVSFSPAVVKIDMAFFTYKEGEEKDAAEINDEVINGLGPYTERIIDVGRKFMQLKWYSYAVETYLKGRKELKGDYPFALELAEVYAVTGDHEKMVAEILFVLQFGDGYLEGVKNAILTQLYGDGQRKKAQLFKDELIKIIQKNPDETVYLELLIWLYLEEQNYSGAFVYSKALDKRKNEGGRGLMALAKLARNNAEFRVAQRCYNYILESYPESYYSQLAKIQLVEVLKEKMDRDPNSSTEDIAALEQAYLSTLKELGEKAEAVSTMRGYARLLSFQMNLPDKGEALLNKAMEIPRISAEEMAQCKLVLGDIYILQGDVWNAALLYGQVATDYKDSPLGHEAKLRAAKAYYYTGNFEWAKAQLDVLKTATSKLIANDAIQLSVLISDNLGMDTTTEALTLFAKADLWYFQHNYDSALFQLNQLIFSFPNHLSLLDEAYFLEAQIYSEQLRWKDALESYQKAVQYDDLLVDDALLHMGRIYGQVLGENRKAMDAYERILLEFESSIYAAEARKRYRELQSELESQGN